MENKLQQYIESLDTKTIPSERIESLQPFIDYINTKTKKSLPVFLNFICTHNSRRSQFSQLWAALFSSQYSIPAKCYSGGVEVTACNPRVITALEKTGLQVGVELGSDSNQNPRYLIFSTEDIAPVELFSKLYDAPENPDKNFCAVMTCAHADENCPFIPGAEARIPVRYEDPKIFDDSEQEAIKYDERCKQIATEMKYVFSQVENSGK